MTAGVLISLAVLAALVVLELRYLVEREYVTLPPWGLSVRTFDRIVLVCDIGMVLLCLGTLGAAAYRASRGQWGDAIGMGALGVVFGAMVTRNILRARSTK